ncbi:MAG: SDR family oxidoreductase [Pseudomonadota bacterium]|nr:SDR family oxidoreductase [Pseudomonadota bacterium]
MKSFVISGAGSGIGRAMAIRLAHAFGARVFLLGRNRENLEETKNLLPPGLEHTVIACDTSDAKLLREKFRANGLLESNLMGVIANAGIGGVNIYGATDRWDEIIRTNLTGPYILAHECLAALKKSNVPYKHMIFVSSVLGKMGVPSYSAYCASKTGILGLTRVLALDWAKDNILVNAICPGWVNTKMAKEGLDFLGSAMNKPFEQIYKEQMELQPLAKWSEPEEIAALVEYLVSPVQRSITGQAIDINNGSMMSQ